MRLKFSATQRREGFTVTELIVAVSLFAIAIAFILGSFFQILKTQHVVSDLMSVNSNSSIIFESFAREARLGFDFKASNYDTSNPRCGVGQYDMIEFGRMRGSASATVSYRWDYDDAVLRRAEGKALPYIFESLTPRNARVHRLCFSTLGVYGPPNYDPWRVTVMAQLGPVDLQLSSHTLNLQTTITSRLLYSDVHPERL